MNILFATPTLPLLTKPRAHHFARGLVSAGHDVHVLALASPDELGEGLAHEAPGWGELLESCASVNVVVSSKARAYGRCLTSLATRTPLRVAYCESPAFEAKARELLERLAVDVVHVERERLARVFRFHRGPKVLDATDCRSLYNRRLLRYGSARDRAVACVELGKMTRYEREMASGYDACLVAATEDQAAFEAFGCDVPVRVIPNGVDPRFLVAEPSPPPVEERLVFVGNMCYPPNVDAVRWFVSQVFPRLRLQHPALEFMIVGASPVRAVTELARVPGVTVTGSVAEVVPYLRSATAFVSPVRMGGGFPNKLAEALAAGTPAVSTPSASAGLSGLVPGQHCLVASDPDDFARHILRLLADRELRLRLASEGHEFIRSAFSWAGAVEKLEAEYDLARSRHALAR